MLYMKVAQAVQGEIQSGTYPIGSRLPTETAMCRRFKASRHTIREALRHLRQAGLISSRQGSGSTVINAGEPGRYVHAVASLSALLQYAKETRFEIRRHALTAADAKLAIRLDCTPGRRWLNIEGFRYRPGEKIPICWVEVFVHANYSGIRNLIGKRPGPIYEWIEERYGERISEVSQTLRAAHVPASIATGLGVALDSPALEIERIYKSSKGKVLEISYSLHPFDRFSYSINLRREEATGLGS